MNISANSARKTRYLELTAAHEVLIGKVS